MPEVVEVCITGQYLNHKLKNKSINNVSILGGRYKRHTLHGLDYFKKNLPMKIKKIDTKGKFMWFELETKDGNDFYILNTYGLEGMWGFEEYKHSNVKFIVDNYNLYFTDQRNFGTLEMTSDKEKLLDKLEKLGPDFLKTLFTNNEFIKRVENYLKLGDDSGKISKPRANKEIVKVLMDQTAKSGLGSGLGNYLVVEILYDAKISPRRKVGNLYNDKLALRRLAKSIRYIVKLAYLSTDVGYMEHLDKGLMRWLERLRKNIEEDKNHEYNFHPTVNIGKKKFEFQVYRQKEDPYGNKVTGDKIISGRTTYWVKSIQQ